LFLIAKEKPNLTEAGNVDIVTYEQLTVQETFSSSEYPIGQSVPEIAAEKER